MQIELTINDKGIRRESVKDVTRAVVRDDHGTPIVILNQYHPIGAMTQFQCLTPQHGEEFQRAVQQLGLEPVHVDEFRM
jgi:hypothetical protein